jgi:hypothetical protein
LRGTDIADRRHEPVNSAIFGYAGALGDRCTRPFVQSGHDEGGDIGGVESGCTKHCLESLGGQWPITGLTEPLFPDLGGGFGRLTPPVDEFLGQRHSADDLGEYWSSGIVAQQHSRGPIAGDRLLCSAR